MKHTTYFFFLFVCLFLNACSDDDPKNDDRPETLAWIEDTMREHYYWNGKIPASPSYKLEPEDFFTYLLYKAEDGKPGADRHNYFSYIEKVSGSSRGYVQEDYSYGFEFSAVTFKNSDGSYYYAALVLYVMDGTPAADAGLKRGDWIKEMDSTPITTMEQLETLYGDVAKTLEIYNWSSTNGFQYDRPVEIKEAKPVEYNPVYGSETFTIGGKKIGYLVYNRFKAGINDNDYTYDNELRELSTTKFNGVKEFVLDLRYNNGGLLTSTRLLCAILGPNSVLSDKKFGYLEYNDKSTEYFQANCKQGNGNNLNLQRLFVLVSETSASASEAVINLLEPYMDVVVIGRTTTGKNVGSNTYKSSDGVWEMHPITFKIFNSEGKSEYKDGIIPDYEKGDVFDYTSAGLVTPQDVIYELGNPNERLLKIALDVIDGVYINNTRSSSAGQGYEQSLNSLDRNPDRLIKDE